MNTSHIALPAPARYFPFAKGRYEIKTGLYTLDTDFGNGMLDRNRFQLDRQFHEYRARKHSARERDLAQHMCLAEQTPALRHANAFILQTLVREYPQYFRLGQTPDRTTLHCELSGEDIHMDRDLQLLQEEGPRSARYANTLDALACQIQEDLALVEVDAQGNDQIVALHLCFPNHWTATDKIGKSFQGAHAPVPHMEKIYQGAKSLLASLVQKGPYVRFAWGISRDRELHHPARPEQPIAFDPGHPQLYLRIERQFLQPLENAGAFLFGIRTYFENIEELREIPAHRQALHAAIASMDAQVLRYKGLEHDRDAILAWLAPRITRNGFDQVL